MSARKMHDDEVEIDTHLVRALLRAQFPHLADLPIEAVESTGTVNAIYRVGTDLCVRMPRVERYAADVEKELDWLPKLAPHLRLAVPAPVARGEPANGYPFRWAVYRWLDGEAFAIDRIDDERETARDLAAFVAELQHIDTSSAPRSGREPLDRLDTVTRNAIGSIRDDGDGDGDGDTDADAITDAWARSLEAPR